MTNNQAAAVDLTDQLQKGIDDGSLGGLHSVLSTVDGEVLHSAYFVGEDESWGESLGVKQHSSDSEHDLRSVTKSIVALLYGIARDECNVPEPSSSLFAQFPEYKDLVADPDRQKITIEHALTMTMGLDWDESLPYTDPRNSEIAMDQAPDRYRFVLEQAIIGEPGLQWKYSGGASAIIGKLISRGTGKPLGEFAKDRLFAPLGITNYTWMKSRDGEASAASGLRMCAPDLARIGQLIVDGGEYSGNQIVSKKALANMLKPRTQIDTNFHYGHFWYLLGPVEEIAIVAARGNGGQRLSVNAEEKLVVVTFSGNYNQPEDWQVPARVYEDYIMPELRKAGKS